MPILKPQCDVYPPNLFDATVDELPWSVAYVQSRREKLLARHLLENRIAFYLPQYRKKIRRSGRTFVSCLPLFPGYVFLRICRKDLSRVWRSGAVSRLIEVLDQHALSNDLQQLHTLQQSNAEVVPYLGLSPGHPVRINNGVFKGYRGVVLREKGNLRLVVSVSLLRRSVAVEFSREMVASAGNTGVLWESVA